jgi:dihydrofolate synthase/folylpolyglutamate synthase
MCPDQPSSGSAGSSGSPHALADAEAWLDGLINREREPRSRYSRFGLEAIEALLARLGNPERELSIVHLAGSKGKGSTALLIEAVLRSLGERVGTFTSPHLSRWTERFRVDGVEVTGSSLARAISKIRPHVDALRASEPRQPPSFFDATTAAALVLFADAGVDRSILEVGLGGRLDSTNAVTPAVTCLTTIELEHTDKLGSTLGRIATEKAGILKPGVPSVIGRLPAEAEVVVRARAAEVGSRTTHLGRDFGMDVPHDALARAVPGEAEPARFWSSDGFEFTAVLGAPGAHQLDNAAVAIAAIRALGVHTDTALANAAAAALPEVSLPARIEVVERDPWVVVDSAHTRDSAAALRNFLSHLEVERVHFVLSVSLDKPLEPIFDALIPESDAGFVEAVTVTRAEPIRARDPKRLASELSQLRPSIAVRVIEEPYEAVRRSREELQGTTMLCVVGSVYLAGIARRVLVGA